MLWLISYCCCSCYHVANVLLTMHCRFAAWYDVWWCPTTSCWGAVCWLGAALWTSRDQSCSPLDCCFVFVCQRGHGLFFGVGRVLLDDWFGVVVKHIQSLRLLLSLFQRKFECSLFGIDWCTDIDWFWTGVFLLQCDSGIYFPPEFLVAVEILDFSSFVFCVEGKDNHFVLSPTAYITQCFC